METDLIYEIFTNLANGNIPAAIGAMGVLIFVIVHYNKQHRKEMNKSFEKVSEKVDKLENKIDNIDRKIDETKDRLEDKIDRTKDQLDLLELDLSTFQKEGATIVH